VSPPRIDVLTDGFISLDARHDIVRAAAWDGEVGGFNCHLEGGRWELPG